jgi:excisionase family DNA binding protein
VSAASPYLLIAEAAAFARVPVKTVRHWLLVKKLRRCGVGRRVLIRKDELEALIERSTP